MNEITIALCQMQVVDNKEKNIKKAIEMIEKAVANNADFIVLPEMFNCPYENEKFVEYCEYENDSEFRELLKYPDEYVPILKQYQGFISPDCSIYRDMPLAAQITNIYRNRAIGFYFQKHGVYVIPCVRWGDERTYTTKFLPEKIAFLGVEKNSIVSVGSYGQLKDKVNRYYFEAGMDSMMETLEPEVVLVYSKMPDDIETKYPNTRFVEYPDWTSVMRDV